MEQSIPMIIALLAGTLFCVVVHEYAHALVAYWLGDNTAQRLGRLTLNPIPHIDPFMSILLPLMMLWSTGVAFGGAKPVPINPLNFRMNRYLGMCLVAAAGPISNFILAVCFGLLTNIVPFVGQPELTKNLADWLISMVAINLMLGLFNLLPIPPLDGSKIIAVLLPRALANWIMSYQAQVVGLILIGILVMTGYTRYLGPVIVRITQWLLDMLHVVS